MVEPAPNLNVDARLMMEGRLSDPGRALEETIAPRVREAEAEEVYGEKHVTLAPFVGLLRERFDCRFVFLKRDGREVVRSLLDWHARMFGNIYRECRERGDISDRALGAASGLLAHEDTSDFARPRPLPEDPWYSRWELMSRFELCAWYWARINMLYREKLVQVPIECWSELDYSSVGPDEILRLAEFLGLRGLDAAKIKKGLGSRINSLEERIGETSSEPSWHSWDGGRRRRFAEIAGPAMEELGYWSDRSSDWRPRGYGEFWRDRAADHKWYEWMWNSREAVHRDLIDWVGAQSRRGQKIRSIADLGCGLGVGYSEAFEDLEYVGIELSPVHVEWANKHRKNPRHKYLCADFLAEPLPDRYDLVMSSGTIDNTYDADAFLRAAVRASRGWIHITCYRGWFPELSEHVYSWSEADSCFYSDLSPSRLRETLESLGCTEISVEPVATGRADIPRETKIVARVAQVT